MSEIYIKNLKKIRDGLDLSRAKFAKILDLSESSLTQYEYGNRTPGIQLFTQLYKKLNVNLNWFISGKGEMFLAEEKASHPSFDEDLLEFIFKKIKSELDVMDEKRIESLIDKVMAKKGLL